MIIIRKRYEVDTWQTAKPRPLHPYPATDKSSFNAQWELLLRSYRLVSHPFVQDYLAKSLRSSLPRVSLRHE